MATDQKYPEETAKYRPGDYVVLQSYRSPRKEYGRIVYSYWDFKYGWRDYYVAFFGTKPPRKNQRLAQKPYVLRYLESSLKPYKE
jgi:hypothetical protein